MILSSVLAFLAIGIDLHEEVQAVILCQTFVHENQYFCFDLVINSVSSLNRVTVLSTAMLLIINTFFSLFLQYLGCVDALTNIRMDILAKYSLCTHYK